MLEKELGEFLEKTDKILGKDWLDRATSTPKDISSYYKKTGFLYRKMHSPEGAMHFPIKEEGSSHKEGLLYHVNNVSKTITTLENPKRVMELGSGGGYNLVNLARLHPEIEFIGLDLTSKNIEEARKRVEERQLKNVTFIQANFDTIQPSSFPEIDLIFSFEALCHSSDLEGLFLQCYHILREKGKIVIFDGYGTEKVRNASANHQRAANYFAKGFFLPQPQYLTETIESARQAGFPEVIVTDFTQNILSNFDRFEDGVKMAFQKPAITRFLIKIKILPIEIFRHCLAGLYGPFLLKNGYAGYFRLEMEKK